MNLSEMSKKGNKNYKDLLNQMMVRRDTKARFGDGDETISSVIGKNVLSGTLTPMGQAFNLLLNLYDEGHAVKSIKPCGCKHKRIQ